MKRRWNGYLPVSSCLNWRKKCSFISTSDDVFPSSVDILLMCRKLDESTSVTGDNIHCGLLVD